MLAGRLHGCLAETMKQCILNRRAQDEAELELVWSLAD
jgi:hypothetical protein